MKLSTQIVARVAGGLAATLVPSVAYLALDAKERALEAAQRIVLREGDRAAQIVTSELNGYTGGLWADATLLGQQHENGSSTVPG